MSDVANKNMLSPVGFRFTLQRAPELNFFVQSVNLPGIEFSAIEQPTPFRNIPIPSDKISFSTLDITFKIDEDMINYTTIFEWITNLGFPKEFKQYRQLEKQPPESGKGICSDANLMILSSSMNPNISIDIQDIFPISLSAIELNTRDTSIEYVEATASFSFLNYTIKKL